MGLTNVAASCRDSVFLNFYIKYFIDKNTKAICFSKSTKLHKRLMFCCWQLLGLEKGLPVFSVLRKLCDIVFYNFYAVFNLL